MMKSKFYLRLALFLVFSCLLGSNSSFAQELNGVASIPSTASVTLTKYSGLRIGDVAPTFMLPDSTGKLWSSRRQLGKQSVILIFVGESPVFVGKSSTPQLFVDSIVAAAKQLSTQHVATFVVSYSTGINLKGLSKEFDALNLQDQNGKLQDLYMPSPTAFTLVATDRAGFLRRIETVRSPSTVSTQMTRVGDCTPMLNIGSPAPDFSISNMNGRVRRLSELRGQKNLLLTFFPKCFTGGCANHLTSLQEEKVAFYSNDTEVIAVSVDPAEGERGQLAFAAQLGIEFDLIPDTGRNLSMLYAATRRPYSTASRLTVLIDKDGIVRYIDKQINVFTHGPDMLSKMKELMFITDGTLKLQQGDVPLGQQKDVAP